MKITKIIWLFFSTILFSMKLGSAAEEITPYKFTDEEYEKGCPSYNIPSSSRFTVENLAKDAPEIIYYFSNPKKETFPIAILCGGSSLENNITSIIHFHRCFLKEFLDLGIAVLTVEQQGV